MFVVVVNVSVKTEHLAAFIALTKDNQRASREEPGNIRYDVLRRTDDPARFVLYEVYGTEADFAAHQQTAHYLSWKQGVADMMAEPRSAQRCTSLLPEPWQ
jgi:autoinducer 2-degrading protein